MFGSVPDSPESRLPMPSALSAPCTTLKSVACGLRRDTRCIATASPMVSIAPTIVTTTNAGSSAQKAASGWKSKPGQSPIGTPNHAASPTTLMSYSPNGAPTRQPALTPSMGDHSRSDGGPRRISPPITSRVVRAASGAATSSTPSGTSVSDAKMTGVTVAAMSMMTTPATVGVKMRLSSDSLAASMNWNSDEMTTRVASLAGPPICKAATLTAMNAPDVPMMSTCPEPNRPMRAACNAVVRPHTIIAANTPHTR